MRRIGLDWLPLLDVTLEIIFVGVPLCCCLIAVVLNLFGFR